MGWCPYVVESIPAGTEETIQVFVINALGIRWQHQYRNDIIHSKWMDNDPVHIPWRVIAGNRGLQGWNLREIQRQLNPLHNNMPYELAMENRRNNRMDPVTLPPIHPETYAEIRMDTHGHTNVFVYFGDTRERVTIDIDVIFLNTDIGFEIQAILRRSQQQGRPLIVPDPDQDLEGDMNAWGNMA